MAGPETRIQRAVQQAYKERGAFVFKVHGSETMMAGLPDLIACYKGVFVSIETKTPVGKVSARQTYVHGRIKRAEGIVRVATSVAEALAVLDDIDTWE